jgi:hypothetical protein
MGLTAQAPTGEGLAAFRIALAAQPVGKAPRAGRCWAFPTSICANCSNRLTQPYDLAWQRRSEYLQANWAEIRRRGRFDPSAPLPGSTRNGGIKCASVLREAVRVQAERSQRPYRPRPILDCAVVRHGARSPATTRVLDHMITVVAAMLVADLRRWNTWEAARSARHLRRAAGKRGFPHYVHRLGFNLLRTTSNC